MLRCALLLIEAPDVKLLHAVALKSRVWPELCAMSGLSPWLGVADLEQLVMADVARLAVTHVTRRVSCALAKGKTPCTALHHMLCMAAVVC